MQSLSFLNKLAIYIKASQPYLFTETHEENLLQMEVMRYCYDDVEGKKRGMKVWSWDEGRGVIEYKTATKVTKVGCKNPAEFIEWWSALNNPEGTETNNIVIVKGFHPYMKLSKSIRAVLNATQTAKERRNMLLFVSPRIEVPYELDTQLLSVEYPLPGEAVLTARLDVVIDSVAQSRKDANKPIPKIEQNIKDAAVEAAKGLTYFQAEDAFSVAIICTGGEFNDAFVEAVFQEKIQAVKKSGLLTYMPPSEGFDSLGGLGQLKKWLKVRSTTFSKEAREYGVPPAKGVMLAGIAGCGKSALAKALSKEWIMPCFQLDVGALFSGTVGSTEANMRQFIRIVEAVGKCIVMIDEVEKSLNISAVAGSGDSGTSSRMFATLLTWMNDHTSPVFTIVTTNNFTILPPELIRKGRLSELFWLDIPDAAERAEIWKVIISRYKRDPKLFDLKAIVDKSDKFTGAEIQEAFIAAMTNSFFAGREVDQIAVLHVLGDSKPQAEINSTELEVMREKMKDKLKPAKGLEVVGSSKEFRAIELK